MHAWQFKAALHTQLNEAIAQIVHVDGDVSELFIHSFSVYFLMFLLYYTIWWEYVLQWNTRLLLDFLLMLKTKTNA